MEKTGKMLIAGLGLTAAMAGREVVRDTSKELAKELTIQKPTTETKPENTLKKTFKEQSTDNTSADNTQKPYDVRTANATDIIKNVFGTK